MKRILMLAMVALPVVLAKAELKTWTGSAGDGIYQTANNWDPVGVPTASDDILIASGAVTYDASYSADLGGGDWYRNANTTFTMTGGSFTQINGAAWMQVSGAIVIEGGAFSMGSSQQINLSQTASVTISGGSFSPNAVNNSGAMISVTGGDYIVNGNYTVKNDSGITLSPAATMTISGELLTGGANVTLGKGNYVSGLVNGGGVLSLDGSKLHSNGGGIGINNGTKVNFVSYNDNAGSYTYNGTDASEAYTRLFASGTITLDGEMVDEETFAANFQVTSTDTTVTIQLVIIPTSWRVVINSVTDVTESSAKATVSVLKVDDSTGSLYYALGATKDEVESASLANMTLVKEGVAAGEQAIVNLTGLEENETYYLGFFLVNGSEIVAASKVASFVATVYDNVYVNGTWSNGQPVPGQRILFKEPYTIPPAGWNEKTFGSFDVDVGYGNEVHVNGYTGVTLSGALIVRSGTVTVDGTSFLHYAKLVMAGGTIVEKDGLNFNDDAVASKYEFNGGTYIKTGECNSGNKVPFSNMVVSATGYTNGGAPITANASRFRSTRRDRRNDLPFGLYLGGHFIDFTPGAVANNVIPPSCGYAWTYDFAEEEGQTVDWPARTNEQIIQHLFSEGRITLNGETVTAETFAAQFVVYDDTDDHSQLMTMFTEMDASTKGSYRLMNGAVVRLAARTVLTGLVIEGTDTIIDLNGNNFSVTGKNAFVLNGNAVERGDYTAAQLNTLAGANIFRGTGNVSVGKVGFALFIR